MSHSNMSPLEIAEDWALEQWMLAREASEWEAARLHLCAEEADRNDEINCSPGPMQAQYHGTAPIKVYRGDGTLLAVYRTDGTRL